MLQPKALLLVLASAAGCGGGTPAPSTAEDSAAEVEDTGSEPVEGFTGSLSPPGSTERCDGIDNDMDGATDEGWPDVDADGIADCVDLSCEVEQTPNSPLTDLDPSACVQPDWTPPGDPWQYEIVWQDGTPAQGCRIFVGDLDGDGVKEILCSADRLYVYNSLTGAIEWTSEETDAWSPILLADSDRDGRLEIFGISPPGNVVAMDATGAVLWYSAEDLGVTGDTASGTTYQFVYLGAADLDADGLPEILSHHGVVHSSDGSTVALLNREEDTWKGTMGALEVAAADLDLDGELTLCTGVACYNTAGAFLWQALSTATYDSYPIPLVVQADTDPEGELLITSKAWEFLLDSDGTQLASWQPPSTNIFTGPTAAFDADGDGISELCMASRDEVRVTELDGTLLWSASYSYSVNVVHYACTTTDLDADGNREVQLVRPGGAWEIYDGATGALLMADPDWTTSPLNDSPVFVDLDDDGSSEAILSCMSYPGSPFICDTNAPGRGITVFRNPDDSWAPTFPLWPYDNFSGVGMNPDGTVQRTADPSWQDGGYWRGPPALPRSGIDLSLELVDACVSSCSVDEAEVNLSIRIADHGPFEAEANTPLAVYGLSDDGVLLLLQALTLADLASQRTPWFNGDAWIDNGTVSPSFEIQTTLAQARNGLVLTLGDPGDGSMLAEECDADDNTLTWSPDDLCAD